MADRSHFLGYRVKTTDGLYVHIRGGRIFADPSPTKPESKADAYRRMADWLDAGYVPRLIHVIRVPKALTIGQVDEAFGDPLPYWYLGWDQKSPGRITIRVLRGYLQHPLVVEALTKLRARVRGGETVSVEERSLAKALRK